nr:MAG TPA: hypothetical protein [Caudoviricetes sp.]
MKTMCFYFCLLVFRFRKVFLLNKYPCYHNHIFST